MTQALTSDDISVVQAPDDTDVPIAMTGVKLANQNQNPAETDSIVKMDRHHHNSTTTHKGNIKLVEPQPGQVDEREYI